MNESRRTHVEEVEDLVLAKHAAHGTGGESMAAEACSEAILKEHKAFARKSADVMQQLQTRQQGVVVQIEKNIGARAAVHQLSSFEDRQLHMGVQNRWQGRNVS